MRKIILPVFFAVLLACCSKPPPVNGAWVAIVKDAQLQSFKDRAKLNLVLYKSDAKKDMEKENEQQAKLKPLKAEGIRYTWKATGKVVYSDARGGNRKTYTGVAMWDASNGRWVPKRKIR